MKKKICIITGSRSDYGIMSTLLKKIQNSSNFDLKLIVSGMHLSKKFGYTYKEILEDKIKIFKKIRLPIKSDKVLDISRATGVGITKYTLVLQKIKPDFVLILGDRFESLSFSIAALFLNLPIVHLHGGESTLAAIDDAIRHSISKMANYHFVSHVLYKKRLIRMGENPRNIFVIGSLGVENVKKNKFYNQKEIENKLNLKLGLNNFLLTFHPETIGKNQIYKNILAFIKIILNKFKDAKIIITAPNIDMGNYKILKKINYISKKNKKNVFIRKSLGKQTYFSLLKFCKVVIGNSSSGIIEVPSLNIPSINIGERQKGRIKAKSVIDCKNNVKSFNIAFKKSLSNFFTKKIKYIKNPYYKNNSSNELITILNKINFKKNTKKIFYEKKNYLL